MLKFFANRLRAAWRVDLDQAVKPLRKDIQLLSEEVQRLRRALEAPNTLRQLDDKHKDLLATLPSVLDEARILSYVRHAIANATVHSDPLDYIVVERLLPDDVYDLLLRAIPPAEFFSAEDPIKQNIPLPMDRGPALTMRVWNFMDEGVAGKAILPATLEKLHAPLQDHYDTIFGAEARERANQLPRRGSGGRLMLRRPGYHLAPHRDPKRSLITCLMYLAKPGDSERYGTQLFRVPDEQEPNCKQTYYPEANGQTCTLVATVPFKPNSMLAFVNSRGAHGATIPHDAPADLERYSYQFYVAPEPEALSTLVKQLPKSRRAMWQSKDKMPQPAYS